MMEARASTTSMAALGRGRERERGVYRIAAMIPACSLCRLRYLTGIWSRLKRWSMEPSYDLLCLSRLGLMFTSRSSVYTRQGMD